MRLLLERSVVNRGRQLAFVEPRGSCNACPRSAGNRRYIDSRSGAHNTARKDGVAI